MVNLHRPATIFAGLFTLVQAIFWCFWCIYSVAIYSCQTDYPFSKIPVLRTGESSGDINSAVLFFYSYYYGPCWDNNALYPSTTSSDRTFIWMVAYSIVSSLWIPTTVLLLAEVIITAICTIGAVLIFQWILKDEVAAIGRVRGKYGACLYYPWLVVTLVLIVMDLVASIIYIIDIYHTLTTSDYLKFLAWKGNPFKNVDSLTVLPAVYMTVLFSRGLLIWIINVVLLGVVFQSERVISGRKKPRHFRAERKLSYEIRTGANQPPDHQRDCGGKRWVNIFHDNGEDVQRSNERMRRQIAPSRDDSRQGQQDGSDESGGPSSPQTTSQPTTPRWNHPSSESLEMFERLPRGMDPDMSEEESRRSSLSRRGRVFDVYGRPLADEEFAHESRSRPGEVSPRPAGGWSYTQGRTQLVLPTHNTVRGLEKPPIPVPDYTIRLPNPNKDPRKPHFSS